MPQGISTITDTFGLFVGDESQQIAHWLHEMCNPAAEVPRTHHREVLAIFPDIGALDDMIIVPTCQKSHINLLNTGAAVDQQKDDLLETFVAWAQRVCAELQAGGYWCDYIDPCSGLPVRSMGLRFSACTLLCRFSQIYDHGMIEADRTEMGMTVFTRVWHGTGGVRSRPQHVSLLQHPATRPSK
jgi:hypothetical protein